MQTPHCPFRAVGNIFLKHEYNRMLFQQMICNGAHIGLLMIFVVFCVLISILDKQFRNQNGTANKVLILHQFISIVFQ